MTKGLMTCLRDVRIIGNEKIQNSTDFSVFPAGEQTKHDLKCWYWWGNLQPIKDFLRIIYYWGRDVFRKFYSTRMWPKVKGLVSSKWENNFLDQYLGFQLFVLIADKMKNTLVLMLKTRQQTVAEDISCTLTNGGHKNS